MTPGPAAAGNNSHRRGDEHDDHPEHTKISARVWPERRTARRAAAGLAAAGLAAAGLAACSSSRSGSGSTASNAGASGSHSSLVVADLAPFSGPDAALGPTYLVSCDGATQAINNAGGVLGHKLTCKGVDTRGDPADAVPATRQMFATTQNLALVIGVTSDEAASVVPVINADKMVVFGMTGQSEFDSTHFQYFYRLVPPDLEESYAMIVIAQQLGYKRIALAFGNDIGSQTFIQPAISAISKAGMTLVANETLDLSASTFRTEADKIVAAHPDVILTEALGPTDATFMSEVKQLNGGKMIPVIGTSATISPDWYKSVAAAITASTLASSFHADNLVTETSGPCVRPVPRRDHVGKGQGRQQRQLRHLPDRAGRRALVRRDQPVRARDGRGEIHLPERLRAVHRQDR